MKMMVCEDCKKRTLYKGVGRPSFCCGSPMKVITSTKVNKVTQISDEEKLMDELKHLEAQQQGVLKAIEEKKKLLMEEQKKKVTISLGTVYDPFTEKSNAAIQVEENQEIKVYKIVSGVWFEVAPAHKMHTVTKRVVIKKQ